MKLLITFAFLFMVTATLSFGLVSQGSLAGNPKFGQYLSKSARYPASARAANKVGKVYVEFNIDNQGKVGTINVLNENSVDPSLSREVTRIVEGLPTQKPASAGDYVLPVVFVLEGTSKKISPPEMDKTFVQLLHEKSLLESLYVTGYTK